MGALHEGHFSLVKKAKEENDLCVVSLFVNPTQFNSKDDFENYPSTLDEDLKALEKLGTDVVFTPDFDSIYPDDYAYEIIEKKFSHKLCGSHRPGHFNGVLTIVMKLLQIVRPQKAYFGEKDYQQFKLIEGLVKAFFIPTKIIPCPIVRDEEGLALSSRNRRLSVDGLNKARSFANNLKNNISKSDISKKIQQLGIDIDYIEEIDDRRYAAINLEDVRLIDNVPL